MLVFQENHHKVINELLSCSPQGPTIMGSITSSVVLCWPLMKANSGREAPSHHTATFLLCHLLQSCLRNIKWVTISFFHILGLDVSVLPYFAWTNATSSGWFRCIASHVRESQQCAAGADNRNECCPLLVEKRNGVYGPHLHQFLRCTKQYLPVRCVEPAIVWNQCSSALS